MEGTRHPHQAMQPMSPWQQQQYQQSGQQFQQSRSGQQFQQPRLGQQYQQPRFQQQYQQSEFRQQHHQSELDQHYQQSEIVPLHQELGLSQFHQHAGFGQQHQQSRLTQQRSNEQFSQIYQQLPKQQQSQHSYDDKQSDYPSHQVSVSGQQQPLSPSPQQQKEAEIMSLLKELQENKNSQIQIPPPLDMHPDEEITPPASLSAEMSAFSPDTLKETESNKELRSQLRQTERATSVRVGLHCASSVNQASIEGVNPTNNTGMGTVKVPVEKSMTHLPLSPGDSSSRPLCSKSPQAPRSSHEFPRFDFSNITRLNRRIAGHHGVSNDCSSAVKKLESALNISNISIDHSQTAFCNSANPLGNQLNSVVDDDSNSCSNHPDPVDDESSSSDGQLSSALHDDSNPLGEQLDSVVHNDSNLSINPLDSVDRDDCSPSEDQLDTALRDDSNPSVDQLEKAIHDDSIPSVDPLDSTVCDDSNPSVDQLESTLCTDSSYPVGPSKDQSGSALGDFNPSDSQTRSTLCGDASPSDHQQVPELCDYSNPSSEKPESTVPENLRFSIRSKNQSEKGFIDSSSSVDHLETEVDNESHFLIRSSKNRSRPAISDDTKPSGQPGLAGQVASRPSVSQPRSTVQDDSSRFDDNRRTASFVDSNSFVSKPRTTLQGDFNASGESSSNSSNCQPGTTLRNYSNPSRASLLDDSNPSDSSTVTLQDKSSSANAQPPVKFQKSNPSDGSRETASQVDSNPSNTQLRTALQNGSTLSDDRPKTSLQDTSPVDSPTGTILQDPNSSDIQVRIPNDQLGKGLNKSKPSGSPTGTSLNDYSSQTDSLPKTAPNHKKPSGSEVETAFISDSHPSNDKAQTALQDKSISSAAQQKTAVCDSKQSDFQPGNALRNHSNQLDHQPRIVSSVNSSLLFEPSQDHPESTSPDNSRHPRSPTNSGPDTALLVNIRSGRDSTDDHPEVSVEEDSGIQVFDKNSKPGSPIDTAKRAVDSNSVPVPVSENERNSDVIPSSALPVSNVKDDFHFVEIKGTPVSISTKVFADPLPADPFESQDIKPTQSELETEVLLHKESDNQKEHISKSDVQEIDMDHSDVQNIHTNNNTAIQKTPTRKDIDVQEIPIGQERDVQVITTEDSHSNDSDTTHFFEENTVYVCEEPVSAVCHVCETNVDSSRYKFHLFFGHLQCGHCNRRLVGCDMLQDMRDPKKSVCKKSNSREHSFKDWTLDPIEFLSYYIRKELVIKRFCASLSGPPTVSEIVDEIDRYVTKLSSLEEISPWKSAIAKCHKYVTERKAGSKAKDKKTVVSVGYPNTKGKFTIKPFFMTGGHTSAKENSIVKPTTVSSGCPAPTQKTVEPTGRPSSLTSSLRAVNKSVDQPAVALAGQPKVTGLEKVRQPTEAIVLDEPTIAVASTSKCNSIPGETPSRNFATKETSQSGKDKSRQSGSVLLRYLSASLNKKGKYSKASAKTGDDSKKQSNSIKVPHMKNTFVKAPTDGNYLVVYYPSQSCPENCPNCYCRFDPSKVTVNCTTSVITNKCVDCALTIFIFQDPPQESTQTVKFPNKRKTAPYKFTGPESKKSRKK